MKRLIQNFNLLEFYINFHNLKKIRLNVFKNGVLCEVNIMNERISFTGQLRKFFDLIDFSLKLKNQFVLLNFCLDFILKN